MGNGFRLQFKCEFEYFSRYISLIHWILCISIFSWTQWKYVTNFYTNTSRTRRFAIYSVSVAATGCKSIEQSPHTGHCEHRTSATQNSNARRKHVYLTIYRGPCDFLLVRATDMISRNHNHDTFRQLHGTRTAALDGSTLPGNCALPLQVRARCSASVGLSSMVAMHSDQWSPWYCHAASQRQPTVTTASLMQEVIVTL